MTQPRMPCYKLGVRFGRPDVIKRFLQSRRSGFYLRVLREGQVAAGDAVEWIARVPHSLNITEFVDLYAAESEHLDLLRRAVDLAELPEDWREHFRERLAAAGQPRP